MLLLARGQRYSTSLDPNHHLGWTCGKHLLLPCNLYCIARPEGRRSRSATVTSDPPPWAAL